MVGPLKPKGYTLIEAIIASFVLVAAFFMVSTLFQAGLRYTTRVEKRVVATQLAENRLGALREWARTQNDWSGFPSGNDPDFPGYSISVSLQDQPLFAPGSELELAHPAQPRRMSNTAKQAIIEVRWDSTGRYVLSTLLTDRFRGWRVSNPIVVSGSVPPIVNPTNPVTFTAVGYDADGREIKDLFFDWYVEPVFPNATKGTIEPTRDGRSATFTNELQKPNGVKVATSGTCRVAARARYGGQERWGYSVEMQLSP